MAGKGTEIRLSWAERLAANKYETFRVQRVCPDSLWQSSIPIRAHTALPSKPIANASTLPVIEYYRAPLPRQELREVIRLNGGDDRRRAHDRQLYLQIGLADCTSSRRDV